ALMSGGRVRDAADPWFLQAGRGERLQRLRVGRDGCVPAALSGGPVPPSVAARAARSRSSPPSESEGIESAFLTETYPGSVMDRRAFFAGAILVLAAPFGAQAQQLAKLPTIGFLGPSSPSV